jgi:hypothetical protein
MSDLLDTNICSAHIRRPGVVAHRFIQHSGRRFVPTITSSVRTIHGSGSELVSFPQLAGCP